ncbi:MAG: MGMT family protein [Chloroflexi bacterium]|nr:MGMT family protein [Chloroflexota bacterium]
MNRTRPAPLFRARVYAVVNSIPAGRVMTYGQVAALIPPPPGVDLRGYEHVKARWVGYAMAECPEEVPWQRVVNSRGRISLRGGEGPEVQRLLLTDEGVVFDEDGRIDLARFAWEPEPGWYASHPELLPPSRSLTSQGDRR